MRKLNCLIAYHTCTNLCKTVLKTLGHSFTDLMKGMMDNHLQPLGIDDCKLSFEELYNLRHGWDPKNWKVGEAFE